MHQALAEVKRALGPQAVIVRTRTFRRGGVFGLGAHTVVEITAGCAAPADAPRRTPAAHRLLQTYAAPAPPTAHERPAALAAPAPPRTTLSTPGAAPAPALSWQSLQTNAAREIHDQISDLHHLVENLVKEQRRLHAPQMPEQVFDVYLDLIQREVADEIARDLICQAQLDLTGNQMASAEVVRQRVVDVLDRMIATAGPIGRNLDGSARVVAFIGPTGVGKTTTIAKLAANFKLRQQKNVGLITIDTYRIGAVDQLRLYAEILDVPLHVVLTPAELAQAVRRLRDRDVVLIDTAGRCQLDQIRLRELQAFFAAAKPHEIHLVLSGTAHQTNLLSAAEKFGALGIDRVIFTKLDEAVSFGVVLSVLKKLQASLSYITTGQDVPDDIEVGNGRRLARLLLSLDNPRPSAGPLAELLTT